MQTNKEVTYTLLKRAEKAYEQALKYGESRKAKAVLHAFTELHKNDNPAYIFAIQKMKWFPVTIDEFVESPEFLGNLVSVWPKVMDSLRDINTDQLCGSQHVYEAIFAGGLGTGKSTRAEITQLYQLYFLSSFRKPQELFQISPTNKLFFTLQSEKPKKAYDTLYAPFREKFENTPFFQKYLNWDKRVKSELRLDDNIVVQVASTNTNALIGLNIISSVVDEINFFARTENSKRANDGASVFDNAEEIYTTVTRRRKSRFITRGISPGVICASSSTKYKGDFTDRRIDQIRAEQQKGKEKSTLIFREKTYEMAPKERYSGKTFLVLYGTETYPTTVVMDDEHEKFLRTKYPLGHFEPVPEENRSDFLANPEGALRDICGVSSGAISPFISRRDKIDDCVKAWEQTEMKPWFTKEVYLLKEGDGYPEVIIDNLPPLKERRSKKFFAHIDLSLKKDRTGLSIVSVDSEKLVGEEVKPIYTVWAMVGIEPDSANNIDLSSVRKIIFNLRNLHGVNIVQCTFDGYESADSIQEMRKKQIISRTLSVDISVKPYELLRAALYEDRLLLQPHDICEEELKKLEVISSFSRGKGRNSEGNVKVDHPPTGCFMKDTLVYTTDGPKSFEQLTNDSINGITYIGKSIDPKTHKIILTPLLLPRVTKKTKQLLEVELENGEIIRCTPEHLFLLNNGKYKQAQYLTSEDTLQIDHTPL